MKRECAYPAGQRGMALVLSLIFLAIVTLVSLSSMQGSMLQGRMAANQQDYSVALQAAEAALKEAERRLQQGMEPSNVWSPYPANEAGRDFKARYRVSPDTVRIVGSRATSESVEMLEVLYRIEAEGTGQSAQTHVALEAFFVREQRVEI
ncbi:pilus assembly PilX family protein [Vreelandella sp. EE27]